jgi:hypothetical protein
MGGQAAPDDDEEENEMAERPNSDRTLTTDRNEQPGPEPGRRRAPKWKELPANGTHVLLLASLVIGAAMAPARADDAEVRRELEAAYARRSQALMARDAGALIRFFEEKTTPDYRLKAPQGQLTHQERIDRLKAGNTPWGAPGDDRPVVIRVTIDKLTVQGVEALAMASISQARNVTDPKVTGDASEKAHEMVNHLSSRDAWVKTATGWKLKLQEVLDNTLTLDGKPFTPPSAAPPKQ